MAKKEKTEENIKVMARLKDLRFKYEVMEKNEAGLQLVGTEVKSIRDGRVNLKDSYCRFQGKELYAVGIHISPYSHGTHSNHDPERPRKLLMHKKELIKLKSKVDEKGLTIVPSRLYFKEGLAKLEIALVKGKKLYDKREDIKRKDQQREMERAIKRYK